MDASTSGAIAKCFGGLHDINVFCLENTAIEPAFQHGEAHIAATDQNYRVMHIDCSTFGFHLDMARDGIARLITLRKYMRRIHEFLRLNH